MDFLQDTFLRFFSFIYPYIHSHLVSYLLVALLDIVALYLNWKWIQKLHRSKSSFAAMSKVVFFLFELFLLGFLIWFVLIYFHTFQDAHEVIFSHPEH